jgi:cytochrome c2
MYYKENVESGCNQCHNKDVVLAGADVLNRGKELFMERGCVGCHKYEGFDRETDGLQKANQQIKQLESDKAATLHQADLAVDKANNTNDDAEAKRLFADANNMRQSVSQTDAKIQQLETSTKYLLRDQKKVGPNLKEVRVKLKKEFIPEWLRDPQAFRPGTKMPTFRLSEEERQAVAAFIWQSGWEGITLPSQPQGDGAHGKELLQTRGCLACHSIGEGSDRVGGDFSANLSRVGDKNNYDYVVRWVHNPRERSLPYSPYLKRDLTKEDYDKAGKPFVFDEQHSTFDGHQLQIQSMTVMPVFRLSDQDARDIATYLTSLKTGLQFPDASFMDNPALKAKGEALVKQYGCAGCHEIKGLEEQQKIGTELTVEGSKPIERFDFALFTHKAEEGILPDGRDSMRNGKKTSWYDAKGFFEQKLTNPAIYDVGKNKGPDERLRMPNIYFRDRSEIDAVSTFLLGSVDSNVPASLKYNPSDQRQFIQDGWWVVKKYNCMGCHNLQIGQRSILMDLPQYQGGEQEKLPPRLVTEGARVNPDWLLRFLKNPSLSDTDTNRNGVRQYLAVRMPTFDFSPNELQTLVRFFNAGSSQPMPYIAEQQEPLEAQERDMARALFTSQAAPCLKCHMTGDPAHDKVATAPNFLLARERLKPGWTERWILNPRLIDPTTAMPSGLFKRDDANNRNVFSGPTPDSFNGYKKDHADLLVRYMFQITSEEQAKLGLKGASPSGGADKTKTTGSNEAPKKKQSIERVALSRRSGVVSSR